MFGKDEITSQSMMAHEIAANNVVGLYIRSKGGGKIEYNICIPVKFVLTKYLLAERFFNQAKPLQEKLNSGSLIIEDPELASELAMWAMRIVDELLEDLVDDQAIAWTVDTRLTPAIHNAIDYSLLGDITRRQLNLQKNDNDNDEWLALNFNSSSYYLNHKTINNNDIQYNLAVSKTSKYLIFAKCTKSEFKTTTHHLYISQDDGLGRYKFQTNDGTDNSLSLQNSLNTYIATANVT
jgi:hypothetical protein